MSRQALAYAINPVDVGLPGTFTDLGTIITFVLPVVITLSGLAAFAFLLLGGVKYLTSGGDDKAIGEARKIITNAILGLLIVFVAYWVIKILETVLGLEILG